MAIITHEKFALYEAIKRTGMFDMKSITQIQKLTNLTAFEIKKIINNYDKYKTFFECV